MRCSTGFALPTFYLPNRSLYLIFKLWLLISSVYYVDTLFSSEFVYDFEEGGVHKIAKYFVCYFFSFYFLIKAKYWILLMISGICFLLAAFIMLVYGTIDLTVVVMLIVSSMLGFSAVFKVWRFCQPEISRLIVYSGAIVGVGSIIEFTLLSENFYAYWAATGGMRSISTLFNPNNLGLYSGVCIILLFSKFTSASSRILLGTPIFFAFFASGSRTAWVSLVLLFLLMLGFRRGYRPMLWQELRTHWSVIMFLLLGAAVTFVWFLGFSEVNQFDSSTRGLDPYTGLVRLENLFKFIDLIDWTVLFPEINGERSELIQDNFYLVFLNSFGLLLSILFVGFFCLQVKTHKGQDRSCISIWRWIVVYYLLSGLGGSFINSFPNNQIFFMAAGALLIGRTRGCCDRSGLS